ncbi:MAG: hypothetical protein GX786_01965 [Clostridiales bacterium]|nr:hypothetical protein [Clostridiales bacterium]
MEEKMRNIVETLKEIRIPLIQEEKALHTMIEKVLKEKQILYRHEAGIGKRSRIDFLVENQIGLEIKKGKPNKTKLLAQVERYLSSDQLAGLIIVVERWVELPNEVQGKPVYTLSMNRLWGIALP